MPAPDPGATSVPPSNGVLHTPAGDTWRSRRWAPPDVLADVVGAGWAVEWTIPDGKSHQQATLPHPSANLVVESSALTWHGPISDRFDRTIAASGRVIGVRFRPGVVRVLTGRTAADLVDATVPGEELGFPAATAAEIDAESDVESAVARLLLTVAAVVPSEPDDAAVAARDAVELIQHDDSIRSVDDLAARLHRSRRSLNRLFADHVGLGPSWVIRRYRLHRTLAHVDHDEQPDWAAIADRVGYYDQAHLVRDFSSTVGMPPARYRGRRA